jgi:OOP family OmpA-OmpF porin
MKELIAASLVVAAGALSSTVMAQGYIGVGIGQSDFKVDCAGTTSCDKKDTGAKVYGGYMFAPNFGVEAAYFDLGKAKATGSEPDIGSFSASIKADGYALYGVAMAPLDNFNVYAKLGVASVKGKAEVSGSLGSLSHSQRHTGFAWGVGAGYEFTKNFGLRLEYERFKMKNETSAGDDFSSDIDLISLGLTYRF